MPLAYDLLLSEEAAGHQSHKESAGSDGFLHQVEKSDWGKRWPAPPIKRWPEKPQLSKQVATPYSPSPLWPGMGPSHR